MLLIPGAFGRNGDHERLVFCKGSRHLSNEILTGSAIDRNRSHPPQDPTLQPVNEIRLHNEPEWQSGGQFKDERERQIPPRGMKGTNDYTFCRRRFGDTDFPPDQCGKSVSNPLRKFPVLHLLASIVEKRVLHVLRENATVYQPIIDSQNIDRN